MFKQARRSYYGPYDCSICQGLLSSQTSETAPLQSGEGSSDSDDGSGMVKVCDKLIDVFMVDKPTPTDWRRLLAFSKNWDSIRPHFFARVQDRADHEEDVVMKQNLLRLARKLKEVCHTFLKFDCLS